MSYSTYFHNIIQTVSPPGLSSAACIESFCHLWARKSKWCHSLLLCRDLKVQLQQRNYWSVEKRLDARGGTFTSFFNEYDLDGGEKADPEPDPSDYSVFQASIEILIRFSLHVQYPGLNISLFSSTRIKLFPTAGAKLNICLPGDQPAK